MAARKPSTKAARKDDRLEKYRAKRSAERTPEPFGGEPVETTPPRAAPAWARPRLFVVQKHAARRLHFDFRLEWGGVLLSWAVPKGPSTDPAEKRFAAEVEDHPVEYADFEGVIPPDNYGAGQVILWDRGLWVPLEEPDEGLRKGKLLFELRGYKMRGVWTLVRMKAKGKEKSKDWLLIKHAGAWAGPEGARAFTPESILSGLTIEELQSGNQRAAQIRAELEKAGAPRRRVRAKNVKLMLAETADRPFSAPGWLFELKYDGFRLLAAREDGQARLIYRRGSDATSLFPEIGRAVAALPYDGLVLDGEVVVLDEEARPAFNRLQKRALLQRRADIERAALERPATLYVFDLLGFEDFDVRPLPLVKRKELLRLILPRAGPLRFSDHVEEQGEALYEQVRSRGLEGIIAKEAASPYRGGRFREWQKVRAERTGDFVVVGFSLPQGSRVGFSALNLGAYDSDSLVYVGRVGTGFSDELLQQTRVALDAERRPRPACTGPVPKDKGQAWVEPRRVCEVRYLEWTPEGLLRQPVFLRFRDDKPARECVRAATAESLEPVPPSAPPREEPRPERKVAFSNLDKVFWPEEGYTKGDLIEFYRAVSPWLLPYLRDRPVVLTRYPDGIAGKSFFQKDAPGFVPGWVRTERMWSDHAQREIDYFICDDLETLLFLINLGTIPLHIWSSRVRTLQHPDWCILDLDPKGAPFDHVVEVARTIRKLSDEIELPTFIKTSGSTGLHVLVPLAQQCTYEQSRSLGELLARAVCQRLPDIATVTRAVSSRGGRVYIDYLQNGHGRLLAGPLSARPVPGATVSTPLEWSEVNARLDPKRFTIRTVPGRLEKMKDDPLSGVLEEKPDLGRALSRLAERMEEGSST